MANRTLTVAAIQTSYGNDLARQHRQDGRLRARGGEARRAGRAAVGAVPGHLLLHASRTRSGSRRRMPVAEHPCVLALQKLAGELRRCHSHLVLREGRPALLQQRRHCRCRRQQSSASIARATSPTAPAIRRSTTSVPATRASRRGRPRPAPSASASAGTSGSPSARAPWRSPAPRCCSIRRPSARSRTTRASTRTRSGSGPCRATRSSNAVPVVAANRIGLEDNDGARQKFYGHSFIADHRGEIVESFGATDEGVLVHTFDLDRDRELSRRLGLFPRPPRRPLCQEHRLIRPVRRWSTGWRSSSTEGGCRGRVRGAPRRTPPSACRRPCRPARR